MTSRVSELAECLPPKVQLDGELLNDVRGMRRKYGAKTAEAIEAFRKRCSEMVTPIQMNNPR